jgi:dolichol-phosphate mannosyltransferase
MESPLDLARIDGADAETLPPVQGTLTVVIAAGRGSAPQLARLLPDLHHVLDRLDLPRQVIVVAEDSDEQMVDAAATAGARLLVQDVPGYGAALQRGFAEAQGEFILTMDADLWEPSAFVETLWQQRATADVAIASRYVAGGTAQMSRLRALASRLLNAFFRIGLDLPIRDLSSGFRLYRTSAIRGQTITATDFDILQQILVQAYAQGWRVREVPFAYKSSREAGWRIRGVRVGIAWLRQFGALWRLRNSILAADYDHRAHDSRIPLQRYWQRQRRRHVTDLIAGCGPVLDVGCGSSAIIGDLVKGSVAVDVLIRKLRYARRFGTPLAQASGFALPFADESFPCVLCSQVIEHVPKTSPILDELCRVLRPGGRLVLGTPDYANWEWVYIEKLYGMIPGGYADEHISHYTREELIETMARRGFEFETHRYILQGELILAFRKRAAPGASRAGSLLS